MKSKNNKDVQKIGTFNCQGLLSLSKQQRIADDFARYKMAFLCVQETHLKGYGALNIKSNDGKEYLLYYSGHQSKSVNGVGFIVDANRKVDFEPISDRICKITVNLNKNKLIILSVYAPTLEKSEKNPEGAENFYNIMESVIKKVKSRDDLIIAGDFNAKTGTAALENNLYKTQIGMYGKGEVNSNGYRLLDFAKSYSLKLTNTFYKHKQCHRSTWESPIKVNVQDQVRKTPYRNQIDYICIKDKVSMVIFDSRSYGGMHTKSDHKLVMATALFKWKYTKRTKITPRINYDLLYDSNIRKNYKEETSKQLNEQPLPTNIQQRWTNIVIATTKAATNILGTKTSRKHHENMQIKLLSDYQKNIKLQRDLTKDKNQRDKLCKERNETLTKIHKLVKQEETKKIERQIEEIEKTKDDSTRMFKAIKDLNKMKSKTPLLIKTENGYTANEQDQTKLIAKYFEKQFYKNRSPLPNIPPKEMKIPFNNEEIQIAINQLQNNKSAGRDNVKAELLKYGTEEISKEIAIVYNEIARTGVYPKEIVQGVITAIQKPGKPKGPIENLRPITLLSMLRKILAICLKKRIINKIDAEIPPSQAAYRQGRSTTEHVFSTKILTEKAITSQNYTIYLLMLDMSKAFDTVDRSILLDDLKLIIDEDALHLIKIMLKTELTIRCGNEESSFFSTDIGVPQGDGLSANEFTLYLSNALYKQEQNDHNKDIFRPRFLLEHNYAKYIDQHIRINQEYADDMSIITTDPHTISNIKDKVRPKLEIRNLNINEAKTEEYKIERNGNEDWRNCKLLGSLLDTDKDITRRKSLAIASINNLKYIFYNQKLNINIKTRVFNCYVSSVFLYNSELWTLTKSKEKCIDSFHRRIIKTACLNIKWPKKISNDKLYEVTGVKPWSINIKIRQLKWFGHLIRLPENTPAKIALMHFTKNSKNPRGRPRLTWVSMITNNLKYLNLTWEQATEMALNRKLWNNFCNTKVVF